MGLMKRIFAVLAAAMLVAPGAVQGQTSGPATAAVTDWRQAAREDVLAAYDIYRRRHPGMYDPHNPHFPARLRRARDTALRFSRQADDPEGYWLTLRTFEAGLRDGHAVLLPVNLPLRDRPLLWPGFTAVWRGDRLVVDMSGPDLPPVGSILIGCDGRTARETILRHIFGRYGRPREAGQWEAAAGTLIANESRYERRPAACRFRAPDGRQIEQRLAWRRMPGRVFGDALRRSTGEDPPPIGLTEPRPGLLHIGLPTFSPGTDGREAYARLLAALRDDPRRLDSARAIVIDLRRNSGGSSLWPQRIADSIWGADAVRAARAAYFRRTETWWLADDASIARFDRDIAAARAQGDGELERLVQDYRDRLLAARAHDRRFFVERVGDTFGAATPVPPARTPRVYVIISGSCVSACLDGVDIFRLFPNVRLIGAPTSGDSPYLETLTDTLPSARVRIVIPRKIWVNRPRGDGAVYMPDIPVTDLEWTNALFLDRIEADLSATCGSTRSTYSRSGPTAAGGYIACSCGPHSGPCRGAPIPDGS